MGFRLAYLDLIVVYSKGQLSHWNEVSPNILAILLVYSEYEFLFS